MRTIARCPKCNATWAPDHYFCPKDGSRLIDDSEAPTLPGTKGGRPFPGGMPVVGEVLEDKYKLERVIGAGGSGVVFEARHLRIDRSVAIKVLKPEVVGDETQLARFAEEARLAGRIDHDGIVEILDLVMPDDTPPYLVMELLEGESLSAHLKEKRTLPPDRTITIAIGVLEALSAAHRREIIHRDVKPGNIFIAQKEGRGEVIKLLDFGIARALSDNLRLTAPGRAVGTAIFMAPEQLMATDIDARADIYSVAAVLYLMLAGETPFSGRSWAELARAKLSSTVTPLRGFSTALGLRLEHVIKHGLERDPADRPDSADEYRTELEQTLEVINALGPQRLSKTTTFDHVDTRKVAVIPFEVLPEDHRDQWAGEALALSAYDDLATRPRQRLVSSLLVNAAIRGIPPEGSAEPAALGHQVGATYALTGTLDLSGLDPRVETRVIEVASGDVVARRVQTGELEEIIRLSVATLENLGSTFKLAPAPEIRPPVLAEIDPSAFKDYSLASIDVNRSEGDAPQADLLGRIDTLISRYPRHPGLRRLRSISLLARCHQGGSNLENDLARIHADLDLLATWGTTDPWVVVGRAKIRHTARFFSPSEALVLTEERRAIHGLDATILLEQASALENLGLIDEAIETLSTVLGHDQTCGPAYVRLATLSIGARETSRQTAERSLDRAARLIRSARRLKGEEQVEGPCSTSASRGWPTLPDLWPLEALLNVRRGDVELAKMSIERAQQSEGESFFALAALKSAECLLDGTSYCYGRLLELMPTVEARLECPVNHEICELACAAPEVWLPALGRWLGKHPEQHRLALIQAFVTEHSGDVERAAAIARVVVATSTSEALRELAKQYADRLSLKSMSG